MTNFWKRSLSMFMALAMVFSLLPMNVFAEGTTPEETHVHVYMDGACECGATQPVATEAPETEAPTGAPVAPIADSDDGEKEPKAAVQYSLVGYINGADYGDNTDWQNPGEYIFADGKLTVTFASDSYVYVKTTDNAKSYMTDKWQTDATSVILHDATVLGGQGKQAEKFFVPAGIHDFTLKENDDGTLTLSYGGEEEPAPSEPECEHEYAYECSTVCSKCSEETRTEATHNFGENEQNCTYGCGTANPNYVEVITGTITENMVWEDGAVIGGVTIAGDVTITVQGTVTVNGTIRLSPDAICNVVFNGEDGAKLIRGNEFAGQMFYAEGASGNFQNLTFNNITLDGGAVWTGDVDKILNRGKTNEGVQATGSVLYLVYANADLNNSVLQNHDDYKGEKANAVFLRYYSTIDFNNSVVRNNNSNSTYYRGGVITVRQGGTATTNKTEVYGNSGPSGGFFGISSTGSFGGVAEVKDSKFYNNYSDNGAVFLMQCSSNKGYLKIDGCEFYNNASKTAVLTEWAYSRPFIISNSSFHDNECAVWDCHADPVLDISGKIVITEDPDYTKYLFETPLVLSGPLAEGSSIAMSEATLKKLGGTFITGTADYAVTEADLAKFGLPEDYEVYLADVNGDGLADVVTSNEAQTEVKLTLKDSANAEASEEATVYSGIACLPVNPFSYDGMVFNGWVDAEGNAVAKQKFTAATTLTATWKIEAPIVTLSRKDQALNINTLVAAVTNKYDNITYTYQWYKDNVSIEGATSNEYTITESAPYKCVVTASVEGLVSVTGEKSDSADLKELPKNYVSTKDELEAALAAAKDNDTIYLIADIETKYLQIDKAITLDLGGYTLTTTHTHFGITMKNGCSIKNGNLHHKGGVAAIKAWDVKNVENLNIKVEGYLAGKTIGGIVIQENAPGIDSIKNVTIMGTGLTNGIETYNCGNATEPVIGSMENVTIDAVGTGMLISAPCGTATNCDIKGGTNGIELWIKGAYSASLTLVDCDVVGGVYAHDEFNSDPNITNIGSLKLNVDANTTGASADDVTLTIARADEEKVTGVLAEVIDNAVAKANGTYYATFAEAVAAGGKVELLRDITLGENLTIFGNVTISGGNANARAAGATITRADNYTGTLFTVNAGATLTLDGGLTIDGGNAWSYTKYPLEMDMANGNGTKVANHITPAEDGVNATASLIVNKGTLNANEVTIQNSYSTNGVSAIDCGASSVTTINGATLQNIAANRSGAVLYVGGADAVLTIKGDTRITGNFGISNGGIIQNYGQGTTVNLEGGSIDNNHVGNSGTVYASYSANANKINTFNMSGGIITKNVMEGYGPVYIHTNTVWNMTGGEISENISFLPSYVRSNGNKGTISGGKIVNNEITGTSYSNGYYATRPDIFLGTNSEITGGTFTQNVTEYLAPDYGLDYNEETGTYGVATEGLYKLHLIDPATNEPPFIPYIEGNNLASLVEEGKAFYANYYKMELEVLYDTKIDKTVVIDYPMTVNLNGKTTTAAAGVDPMFRIESDVVFTGSGKVDARNGEAYAFILGKTDGTEGNLTINGDATYYGETTVASVTNGTLTINGGKFAVNPYEGSYEYTLNCIDANYKAGTANVVVNGGVFYKFNPANNAAEGAGTNFLSESGVSEELSAGFFTVRAVNYVAQIGDTQYKTLAKAIEAAKDGDTITLISDIDIRDAEIVKLDGSYNTYFKVEEKTVTIDLNGKTINGEYAATDAMMVGLFSTDNNGHLTLTGNGTVDIKAIGTVYALIANYESGCSITIENGSFTLDKAKDCLIYSGGDASEDEGGVTIYDGTYTLGNVGTGTNGQPWIFNTIYQNANKINVYGGTFNADISHQFWANEVYVPETKALKNNNNGTWTIDTAVAYVTEKATSTGSADRKIGYATLAEAIAAKSIDNVVTLLANNTENVTIDKAVELVLNGFAATGEFTLSTMDATLTAPEGLVVVCTDDLEGYMVVYANGTYKLGKVVAMIGTTSYSDVSDAIAAATAGDTVVMVDNAEEDAVVMLDGITLDLAGYTLKIKSHVAAFSGNYIIDSVGGGRLNVARSKILIDDGNTYLPIWDDAVKGYAFAAYRESNPGVGALQAKQTGKPGDDKVTYVFIPNLALDEYGLIAKGAEASGVKMKLIVSWTSETGSYSKEFVYAESFIETVYKSYNAGADKYTKVFSMDLTGTNDISALSFQVCFESESGIKLIFK